MGWIEMSVLVLASVGPGSCGTRDGGRSGQSKSGVKVCLNTGNLVLRLTGGGLLAPPTQGLHVPAHVVLCPHLCWLEEVT